MMTGSLYETSVIMLIYSRVGIDLSSLLNFNMMHCEKWVNCMQSTIEKKTRFLMSMYI